MEEIYIRDNFIKLGQALKLSGAAGSGVDAKLLVNDGLVKVNGEVCKQRGKKLVKDDVINYDGIDYIIVTGNNDVR